MGLRHAALTEEPGVLSPLCSRSGGRYSRGLFVKSRIYTPVAHSGSHPLSGARLLGPPSVAFSFDPTRTAAAHTPVTQRK